MTQQLFLDSSFWICLRDQKEMRHERARDIARQLLSRRAQFVVTPLIFAETHAYFSRAARLAQQIITDFEDNPVIRCEQLAAVDQQEAIRLLRQHRDKSYSFCDAVSFALMGRLGIRCAVSFDEHFRQFGEFDVVS
jgi:uncharacterized protein